MKIGKNQAKAAAVAASGIAAMIAAPSLANHSWGSYHWERTTGPVTIPVIDHTTGVWAGVVDPSADANTFFGSNTFVEAANKDWNAAQYIKSAYNPGGDNTSCGLALDEIHVCNDNYGGTGWLGIASISVTRGKNAHIVAGSTKLNDYYFNMSTYNTFSWRMLVTCQEIGHDYGLGHQDENFYNANLGTCMDYTDDPDGTLKNQKDNQRPNQHDYDMLDQIYAHSHGDTTTSGPTKGGGGGGGNGKGKKLGVVGNTPAEWGTAIASDAQGRPNVYRREMDGYDVITHVTWAIGEGPDSQHVDQGPRMHSGDHIFIP